MQLFAPKVAGKKCQIWRSRASKLWGLFFDDILNWATIQLSFTNIYLCLLFI